MSFGVTMAAALPDALFALWLKLFANGIQDDQRDRVLLAAVGLGASAAAGWFRRPSVSRTEWDIWTSSAIRP